MHRRKSYRDHASLICVISEGKTVFVRGNKEPPLLKFPGGHRIGRESPRRTASRELKGETGLIVRPDQLFFIDCFDLGTHDKYFFGAYLKELHGLLQVGDDGEEVVTLPVGELKA